MANVRKAKTPKTQGWYWFEDGYCCWVYGLSAWELQGYTKEHGKITKFKHTTS